MLILQGEDIVEAVRQIIDSKLLDGVISLPKDFQNEKVEIIVFLRKERKETAGIPKLTMNEIDKMLEGSVTESLIGVLPQTNMTLEDYQAERLGKYESSD